MQYNHDTVSTKRNNKDVVFVNNRDRPNSTNNGLRTILDKKFIEKFETYKGLDWEKDHKNFADRFNFSINEYLEVGGVGGYFGDYTNQMFRSLKLL